MKIKIGTRGSKLALWQAHHVQDLLRINNIDSEIVTIQTKGDKILDVSISKIGSKGVFTEEIEDQLRNGSIDIAVHSAKDMPSRLAEGFSLIAFGQRELAHDVLISQQPIDLTQQICIGTSSTRREAFLKKHHPQIKTVAVRGNLQTRIRKMEEGACDALWLAYAGVHRLGYDDLIQHTFALDVVVPAVGQGSIAIETYQVLDLEKATAVRKAVNNADAEICIIAERAFLQEMNGGCSIPVYGHARLENEIIVLKGGIVSLDGTQTVENTCTTTKEASEKAGKILANYILNNGGLEILAQIRLEQHH